MSSASPDFERGDRDAERLGHRLDRRATPSTASGTPTLAMIASRLEPRHDLAQELHSLADDVEVEGRQAGDVAAGSRQARHQPDADRVRRQREDDGNVGRRLLCDEGGHGCPGQR